MARLFDGTNDSLQASSVDLSAVDKIGVSCWFWWDAYASDDDLLLEHSANVNTNAGAWFVDPNDSNTGNKLNIAVSQGNGANYCIANIARPSAAAWHNLVFNIDLTQATSEISEIWVDGSAQTITYFLNNNVSTTAFRNDTLNFMSRNNASLFGAGRLAEVAVWPGVLLTGGEALALADGIVPLLVRPTAQPYYWPLHGNNSPENERFYGKDATVNGAVWTRHPRVQQVGAHGWFPAAAAAAAVSLAFPGRSSTRAMVRR